VNQPPLLFRSPPFPGMTCYDFMHLHFFAPLSVCFVGLSSLDNLTFLPTSTLHVVRSNHLSSLSSAGLPSLSSTSSILCPHPFLVYFGIHDRFIYLFDFWVPMDLGDPKVVNFTCKPPSIFSTYRSIRTLSSVFSPFSSHSPVLHSSLLFHIM